MEVIKEYLFGVIAAGILCTVVSQLTEKEGFLGKSLKLITGIFMILALVAPLMELQIAPIRNFDDISLQAEQITSSAEQTTRESICVIIKERTQAYILDKAKNHGADLSVEVALSDGEIPEPVCVTIKGSVSPYARKILSETIEKDLGIGMEAQIWI